MEKWKINDLEITYSPADHKYTCNGMPCISITQFIHLLMPNKYDGIDEEVLKKASERGSLIHEAIELFETMDFEDEELQELKDYKVLKNLYGWTTLHNEVPVVLPFKDIFLCGRLDIVLQQNEKIGLADIKTTCTLDKEYLAIQLNLYRLAYQFSYNEPIDFLKAIHLRKGVRKYVDIPINEKYILDLLEKNYEELKEIK